MSKNDIFGIIDVWIDNFTPYLQDNNTGEIVDTEVIRIRRKTFLSKYNKANGWYTDWAALADESEIYALVVTGSVDIQGLVAIQHDTNAQAVYIQWMCDAQGNTIEEYMAAHQHDKNADELWQYFQRVIGWIKEIFPIYSLWK